jgi:hypothetical protein
MERLILDITAKPTDEIYEHLITPRVELLSRRELAQTAVRRELVAAGASRAVDELSGMLALARTLGVTVAEAQRLSGFARQTLYTAMNAPPADRFLDQDNERLARLLNIAIVAAGAEQTLAQIAAAMNVAPAALLAPARLLDSLELARFSPAGSEVGDAVLAPTKLSTEWLRLHASSRELDDRAPGYTAYLRVAPADVRRIDAVLGDIVGLGEAAVLPASTAPSVMEGPELAVTVRATDQRAALRCAEAIWKEIGDRIGKSAPMRVADLHPPVSAPNASSAVLDGFLAALTSGLGEEIANRIRGERERYDGGEPERVLAGRCLTMAARELRRKLGRADTEPAPTITDGDAAFEEWVAASGHGLTSATPNSAQIRRPLLEALKLAAERLGPFPGGELASFKAPGERPSEPRKVAPSKGDLAEIARLSGTSIAAGEGDDQHLLAVIRAVLDGTRSS